MAGADDVLRRDLAHDGFDTGHRLHEQAEVAVDLETFQNRYLLGEVRPGAAGDAHPAQAVVQPPLSLEGLGELLICIQQAGALLQKPVHLVHEGGNGPGVKAVLVRAVPVKVEIKLYGVFLHQLDHVILHIEKLVAVRMGPVCRRAGAPAGVPQHAVLPVHLDQIEAGSASEEGRLLPGLPAIFRLHEELEALVRAVGAEPDLVRSAVAVQIRGFGQDLCVVGLPYPPGQLVELRGTVDGVLQAAVRLPADQHIRLVPVAVGHVQLSARLQGQHTLRLAPDPGSRLRKIALAGAEPALPVGRGLPQNPRDLLTVRAGFLPDVLHRDLREQNIQPGVVPVDPSVSIVIGGHGPDGGAVSEELHLDTAAGDIDRVHLRVRPGQVDELPAGSPVPGLVHRRAVGVSLGHDQPVRAYEAHVRNGVLERRGGGLGPVHAAVFGPVNIDRPVAPVIAGPQPALRGRHQLRMDFLGKRRRLPPLVRPLPGRREGVPGQVLCPVREGVADMGDPLPVQGDSGGPPVPLPIRWGGRGQIGRTIGGRRVPYLYPAKGEENRQGEHESCRRNGADKYLWLTGNAADPLPETPLFTGHGGGKAEEIPGSVLGRHQGQQGLAIGGPLTVPQRLQGSLVAGQLPVPAAEAHRQPHQGVPPVDGQGRAPQDAPQVVPVPVVGQLVGQHMAEQDRVPGRLL